MQQATILSFDSSQPITIKLQPIIRFMRLLFALLLLIAVSPRMLVHSPPALVQIFANKYPNGAIPYAIANYGIVPYGKTISGQVGIPSILQDCIYQQLPDSSYNAKILLVERRGCSFTQKSINVQKQGGKMAVVIDTEVQDPGSIVMADDGKGSQVNIPTVLISREDGQLILEYLSQGEIVLSVSFQVEIRQTSDLQLWIDITDHKNFVFLRGLQPFFQKIQNHVILDVGYATRKCAYECPESNCFYGGKYCMTSVYSGTIDDSGRQIIREQLRQYFIFKNNRDKWWDYVLGYDDECIDLAVIEECSAQIMKNIGLNWEQINRAVEQSFEQQDNQVLRSLSEKKYNNSITYFPSVVVNNFVYRGNLEPFEVYQLICESLTPQPKGCQGYDNQSNSQLTFFITIGIVSGLVFILFLIIFYRRIARRQLSATINKQVNQLVNHYITMYENDRFTQDSEMKEEPTTPTVQQ